MIAIINIFIDTICITKLKHIQFLNMFNTNLIKIKIITIFFIYIKTFSSKKIKANTVLKH